MNHMSPNKLFLDKLIERCEQVLDYLQSDEDSKDFAEHMKKIWAKKHNRSKIRLGAMYEGIESQVHHIIPIELAAEPIIFKAAKGGWNINSYIKNGEHLPTSRETSDLLEIPYHNGSHHTYTEKVKSVLDAFSIKAGAEKWDDSQTSSELLIIVADIRCRLQLLGGGKHVNEIDLSDIERSIISSIKRSIRENK
jgi:hypothetical protein